MAMRPNQRTLPRAYPPVAFGPKREEREEWARAPDPSAKRAQGPRPCNERAFAKAKAARRTVPCKHMLVKLSLEQGYNYLLPASARYDQLDRRRAPSRCSPPTARRCGEPGTGAKLQTASPGCRRPGAGQARGGAGQGAGGGARCPGREGREQRRGRSHPPPRQGGGCFVQTFYE